MVKPHSTKTCRWRLRSIAYLGLRAHELWHPRHQVPHQGWEKQYFTVRLPENLAQIIKIVRAAGVRKVIWCSTTLSPQEVCGAPSEDFVRYNQAAREVANAANAIINDLYSFSLPRLADIQIPRNSHFTPRGSTLLGEQVAAAIRASLFS